jgi:hypothetical protein
MKHVLATLALLAAVAAATGLVAFHASVHSHMMQGLGNQDPMEWLRADFKLTDEQFAAIKQLHESYSVACEEHCRQILRAEHARTELKAGGADATALAAADRRVEELRQICESAIAAHVRACAKCMSPEAGGRYLALVLPRIKDFDHQAAPDIRMDQRGH